MNIWKLEFFQVQLDGRRIGGDVVTNGSASIEQAVAKARSIMENNTFHFGRANLCVISSQDGSVVQEVIKNGQEDAK